jgi:GT2 family glycosyltransferase
MNSSCLTKTVHIFAVIVLYQTTPDRSTSFQSLRESLRLLPTGLLDLKILLYDNTPGGQEAGQLPEGVFYKSDIRNSGLAAAYNYALALAEEAGCDWLLTLDQDTTLPNDYLVKLCSAAAFASTLDSVAAIVPCLFGGDRAMSPWVWKNLSMRPSRVPEGYIGIPPGDVSAANSVSTVSVSALKSIGGYDPRFRLWASDLVLYKKLQNHGFKVFVAGNIHVEHEVSILDLKHRSTPGRYEEMLRADEAFYDEYMGFKGHLIWLMMILHRLIFRIWTTGGSFSHFRIALKFLMRGLFYTRKRRMESWKRIAVQRGFTPSVSLLQ